MSNDKQSKTEKPTAQRLKKAREEGQVARSAELGSWVTLAAASVLIPPYIGWVLRRLAEHFAMLSALPTSPNISDVSALGKEVMISVGLLIAVPLGLNLVLSVGASLAQTGIVSAPKALKPKLSRLSWKQGFKKVFSKKSAWETGKQTFRLVTVAAVAIPIVVSSSKGLTVPGLSLTEGFEFIVRRVTLLLQVIALTGVVLSVLDFFFQKRSTRNDLKMTKQEVRQESKNNDGDPLIKGRRRQLQAELSRNRTLATVADSTVVIVNPVHFAVALKYEAGEGVPVVTARAAEGKAVEIRDEALAAGVPVIECVPLARHLHKKTRRGYPIPAESYAAVAVALAFVSKLGNKKGLPVIHRLNAETVGMSNDESDIYTGDSPALQPTS